MRKTIFHITLGIVLITLAASGAKARAVARPMPDAPPLITTTLLVMVSTHPEPILAQRTRDLSLEASTP